MRARRSEKLGKQKPADIAKLGHNIGKGGPFDRARASLLRNSPFNLGYSSHALNSSNTNGMDIYKAGFTYAIQEISQEELNRRTQSRYACFSKPRPASQLLGPSSRSPYLNPSITSHHTQASPSEPGPSATQPSSSTSLENAISSSTTAYLDVSYYKKNSTMHVISDATSDTWPGRIMDVKRSVKTGDSYSASREGHLLAELILQALLMWGASVYPINMLKSTVHSQLEASAGEKEKLPLIHEFGSSTSSLHDCSPNNIIPKIGEDGIVSDEAAIQEYDQDNMPKRRKLKFAPPPGSDNDEDDILAPITRTQVNANRKLLREIENLETQIERLRFLILEEAERSSSSHGLYLSHVLVFVGASISTSRLALCFVRQPMNNAEPPHSNSSPSHDPQLQPKSRADDVWIRSVLRQTLQYDFGTPTIMSRQRCRIHLLVCYSALPGTSTPMPPSIPCDQLQSVRLSRNLFTKWNPKRPMRTIRIRDHEPGVCESSSMPTCPLFFGRLGDPVSLL